MARLHAVVRRANGHANGIVQVGNMSFDLKTRALMVDNVPVRLTAKEVQIVEILSLRKGSPVPKHVFLDLLYGGMDEPNPKIIDVFICNLRKKIAKVAMGENYIENIWGQGYTLREP